MKRNIFLGIFALSFFCGYLPEAHSLSFSRTIKSSFATLKSKVENKIHSTLYPEPADLSIKGIKPFANQGIIYEVRDEKGNLLLSTPDEAKAIAESKKEVYKVKDISGNVVLTTFDKNLAEQKAQEINSKSQAYTVTNSKGEVLLVTTDKLAAEKKVKEVNDALALEAMTALAGVKEKQEALIAKKLDAEKEHQAQLLAEKEIAKAAQIEAAKSHQIATEKQELVFKLVAVNEAKANNLAAANNLFKAKEDKAKQALASQIDIAKQYLDGKSTLSGIENKSETANAAYKAAAKNAVESANFAINAYKDALAASLILVQNEAIERKEAHDKFAAATGGNWASAENGAERNRLYESWEKVDKRKKELEYVLTYGNLADLVLFLGADAPESLKKAVIDSKQASDNEAKALEIVKKVDAERVIAQKNVDELGKNADRANQALLGAMAESIKALNVKNDAINAQKQSEADVEKAKVDAAASRVKAGESQHNADTILRYSEIKIKKLDDAFKLESKKIDDEIENVSDDYADILAVAVQTFTPDADGLKVSTVLRGVADNENAEIGKSLMKIVDSLTPKTVTLPLDRKDIPEPYRSLVQAPNSGSLTISSDPVTGVSTPLSFTLNLTDGTTLILNSSDANAENALTTVQNTAATSAFNTSLFVTQINAGTAALLNGLVVSSCL